MVISLGSCEGNSERKQVFLKPVCSAQAGLLVSGD
jgi:hypothetical protein